MVTRLAPTAPVQAADLPPNGRDVRYLEPEGIEVPPEDERERDAVKSDAAWTRSASKGKRRRSRRRLQRR